MRTALLIRHVVIAMCVASAAAAQQQPQVFLNINPSWSPDGRWIAFDSDRDGHDQLFVMTVATRAVRPLHVSRANDTAPSVSPDGRYVALFRDRPNQPASARMPADTATAARPVVILSRQGTLSS